MWKLGLRPCNSQKRNTYSKWDFRYIVKCGMYVHCIVNDINQGLLFRNLALEAADDSRLRERLAQLERTTTEAERFSALRVFTVGRPTLLGVMSTVATYLIIVMQST